MQANAISKNLMPTVAKLGEIEGSRRNRGERGPSGRNTSPPTLFLQPGSIVEITSGVLRGSFARVVCLMDMRRLDPRALVSARQVIVHVIGSSGRTFATLGGGQIRHASEGIVLRNTSSDVRSEGAEERNLGRNRK